MPTHRELLAKVLKPISKERADEIARSLAGTGGHELLTLEDAGLSEEVLSYVRLPEVFGEMQSVKKEEAMNPLERLKTLTRPMDQHELEAFLMKHYGAFSRENISSDETALLTEDLAQIESERANDDSR